MKPMRHLWEQALIPNKMPYQLNFVSHLTMLKSRRCEGINALVYKKLVDRRFIVRFNYTYKNKAIPTNFFLMTLKGKNS